MPSQQGFTFTKNDAINLDRKIQTYDIPTFLAMIALIAIGLVSIYSATYDNATMSIFFKKQLIFAFIGLFAFFIATFIPERYLRYISPSVYGITILLLVLVLIPGIGMKINGQRCWINLGGFQFQPSELAKLSTLFMVGRLMENKNISMQTLRDVIRVSAIVIVPALLILGEKDTGTALVFFAALLGILLWSGADLFMLFGIAILPIIFVVGMYCVLFSTSIPLYVCLGIASGMAFIFRKNIMLTIIAIGIFVSVGFSSSIIFNKLPDHQQSRIRTLFEPEKYPKDEGYNVIQSMIAVGSGGLVGKGFLQGTQTQLRYIPEQWTDFIYCVTGEEFGFIGSVTVLGLLCFLVLRFVNIAKIAQGEFASVIAFGFASIILFHTIVNIGMAIGVFPVMGIPLPFLSSGGTALIVNMTAVGLLLNFYRARMRADALL